MQPFYPPSHRPLTLREALGFWTYHSPLWHLREVPVDNNVGDLQFLFFAAGPTRMAGVQEVAETLVEDPAVQEALAVLVSPAGQEIEDAVASIYLTPVQAELLTKALTLAWKTVRNQNLPLWKRADVLVGASAFVALLGLWFWGES